MKYQRKDFVSEQIENELIVYDHETSRLIKLNTTAGFIWNMLGKPLPLRQILEKVCGVYSEVNPREVRDLLKTLTCEKVIRTVE